MGYSLTLAEKYRDNRVLRSLIQLIPAGIGSGLDVSLVMTIDRIRKERATAFFDELATGNIIVDEELLKSEDFLHCYFATAKYALNTRRREKIKKFARLLKSSLTEDELHNTDEYEELLKILDDLSFRELQALAILDQFSSRPTEKDHNDLQWTTTIWQDFKTKLSEDLSISADEVTGFINKISRTGCYELFTGANWGYEGGMGMLTPIYHRLKKYILEKESEESA